MSLSSSLNPRMDQALNRFLHTRRLPQSRRANGVRVGAHLQRSLLYSSEYPRTNRLLLQSALETCRTVLDSIPTKPEQDPKRVDVVQQTQFGASRRLRPQKDRDRKHLQSGRRSVLDQSQRNRKSRRRQNSSEDSEPQFLVPEAGELPGAKWKVVLFVLIPTLCLSPLIAEPPFRVLHAASAVFALLLS